MNSLNILILAADKGTRLKSSHPKVLHSLAGQSLLQYVLDIALALEPVRVIIVAGHEAERVKESLTGQPFEIVLQDPLLGTGHAVQVARSCWGTAAGSLLILSGDVPLIREETLRLMAAAHRQSQASATLLSTRVENPAGYRRVVRDKEGGVKVIVEHKDATYAERRIDEINAGIYLFEIPALGEVISQLSAVNAQKEYDLSDCIALLKARGKKVSAVVCEDSREVSAVNSRVELAQLEKMMRERTLEELMLAGVTIMDPGSTYISRQARIGPDTIIYPNVFIEGSTSIGSDCCIYPNTRISHSVLEDRVIVYDSCVIEDSTVHRDARVGPFSRLRPQAEIGNNAHIGNFVEVKKSKIGPHTKAMHHSYLGDATIGEKVNIGAGTIICNYDGVNKNPTIIGDGAFIGSDSQLIAPVRVGKGAYVAAGSSISEDVPDESLAIARSRQVNKEGWARQRREKSK
jgi:bifunctional UDP-N-acetylglucosamine pyrophosphorylase / glucosamine-1-phosphate N-acetyltransferase